LGQIGKKRQRGKELKVEVLGEKDSKKESWKR